jgi:hypothetical protein
MKLTKICANSMGPARAFIPSVLLIKALKIKWSESTKLMHICGVENPRGNCEQAKKIIGSIIMELEKTCENSARLAQMFIPSFL